ncbi:MAG: CoA-binding protein [bacterium]|nr:CoA-binding protein [bacterium]
MQNFFTPKSIAVIGVSQDTKKVGHIIFKNIYKKFKSYPVHPTERNILGEKAYARIEDIPQHIDLVIIAIPAKFVVRIVRDCGRKGINHCIIVSSGFKEIGNEILEYELAKALDEYNMKCIGPNCLGVFDAHSGLDSLFLPVKKLTRPKAGGISFISQSGAVGSAVLDLLADEHLGFAKFISYGNGTNLSETDFLEYLEKDSQTKVICMYIESIHDGRKFMAVAKKIKKPIIILKGGRSQQGAKATLSHTGSLAGSYEIYKGAFEQSGVIVSESLEEVFHIAKLCEMLPKAKGKRVQVITNGGGYGILTIDECEAQKISLAKMSQHTRNFLKHHVPKIVTIANPMDLVGDTTNERYGLALKMCIDDKNIDVILLIILHQTPLIDENIVEVVRKHAGKKPIIVISTGGEQTKILSRKFEEARVPVFSFPKDAVSALKKWLE